MSQSAATKLISKLRFKIQDRRRLRNPQGPVGRQNKIKKTVTALFKHERLELSYSLADESRGYAERLISDAIRYGDCHAETMELATYWITEKQIIHKLFKVLAPRYQHYETSYTKLWHGPNVYPGHGYLKCVLELRDNIYPPLGRDKTHDKNLIHNVLLEAAKIHYRKEKAEKAAAKGAAISEEAVLGTEVSHSENKEINLEADINVDSHKMSMTEQKSELPSENLKADSDSISENLRETEVSTSEVDIDLEKINIKEKQQIESPSEVEKK